jgi:hypothetical protein
VADCWTGQALPVIGISAIGNTFPGDPRLLPFEAPAA